MFLSHRSVLDELYETNSRQLFYTHRFKFYIDSEARSGVGQVRLLYDLKCITQVKCWQVSLSAVTRLGGVGSDVTLVLGAHASFSTGKK